jgi:hypothetical protein
MENETLLKSIDDKLSAIIALLSYNMDMTKEERPKSEVIISLAESSLNPTKIAKILGKKPDTVIKMVNRAKK